VYGRDRDGAGHHRAGVESLSAPPFDAELAVALSSAGDAVVPTLTRDMIPWLRGLPQPTVEELIGTRELKHVEYAIPGRKDAPTILVSVFQRRDHQGAGPGLFYVPGGGMVLGNRFTGVSRVLDWVNELDLTAVTVEYRHAPEYPYPAALHDCYSCLLWIAEHSAEIGIDSRTLIVAGASAGGGLAAAITLLARDRKAPQVAAQLLICPMLDDRNDTVSSHQITGIGYWDRTSNETGWDAYLGDRRHADDLSQYAAAARAQDLRGLPPTFIDVGSAEVFRDESVAYASRIWAAGGIAELHVWPGGFHTFDLVAPQTVLSASAREIRTQWISRIIAGRPSANARVRPDGFRRAVDHRESTPI
jgi:acetyl esterase/lipase